MMGWRRSALDGFAFFTDGAAFFDLSNVVGSEGNLAGCVADVHVDRAGFFDGLNGEFGQGL